MSARHKARKRALDLLYEAEIKGLPLSEIWQQRVDSAELPTNEYTEKIILGLVLNQSEVDAKISEVSTGWRLERMSPVDRSILRIGVFEILFQTEIDAAVAINESILLAQEISSDEAPAFINGVLGAIARLPGGAEQPAV
jgi:transcription antitermination protein NusB